MIAKNEGLLINGGGHKMAAGLKISFKKYNNFLNYINNIFKKIDSSYFQKIIYYDSVLTLDEINAHFIDNIEKLEPFGNGNPEPRFIIKNVCIEYSKIIKEKHILLGFRNNNDVILKGICFNSIDNNLGQNLIKNKSKIFDLGCSVRKDVYQNSIQPQIIIHDAIIIN